MLASFAYKQQIRMQFAKINPRKSLKFFGKTEHSEWRSFVMTHAYHYSVVEENKIDESVKIILTRVGRIDVQNFEQLAIFECVTIRAAFKTNDYVEFKLRFGGKPLPVVS